MNDSLISDQELKDLLEKDILELIGAQNLPQEKKEELYKTMADTVQNRTIARIYDELSEADTKELDALLDQNAQEKVAEFLKGKNIDLTGLLMQEAMIYKSEMMALFKESSKGEDGGTPSQ